MFLKSIKPNRFAVKRSDLRPFSANLAKKGEGKIYNTMQILRNISGYKFCLYFFVLQQSARKTFSGSGPSGQ